jgi:hypothetical protein
MINHLKSSTFSVYNTKLFAYFRAALIGWLPASFIFSLFILTDSQTFGFVSGSTPLAFGQAFYLFGMIAILGIFASFIIGWTFGVVVLIFLHRIKANTWIWSAIAGLIGSLCLTLSWLQSNSTESIAIVVYCGITSAICQFLAMRALKIDIKQIINHPLSL